MIIDLFVILVVIALMVVINNQAFKSEPAVFKKQGLIIMFIHIITIFGYYFLTRNGGGDAWGYWLAGKQVTFNEAIGQIFKHQGTYFMHGFNYFFSGALGVGFLANTFIYGAMGYIGLLCFYKVALHHIKFSVPVMGIHIFPFLFFIPMLHFWCSGVGKDSVLMFCIGLVVYASVNIIKRIPVLVCGLLLSYLVRPHITLMLLMAYGMAFLMSKEQALWKRIMLGAALLVIGLAILPSVLEFAKIGEASLDSFSDFSSGKAEVLSRSHTGSSVDISSYPLPLKWLTFLFRPFFFDINGIPAVVASFENLFIVAVTIKVIKSKPLVALRNAPLEIKAMFFFLVLGTLAFSPTLGNLGIMIRMRNMFLPGMFLFYLWVTSNYIRNYVTVNKRLYAKT